MTTWKRNKPRSKDRIQGFEGKIGNRHIKHQRHCIRVSEAHAFYPRRILCMAAHLENTEENGFWPFSHLRIAGLAPSAVCGGGCVGGGGGAGDYIRDGSFLPRWVRQKTRATSHPRFQSAAPYCCKRCHHRELASEPAMLQQMLKKYTVACP